MDELKGELIMLKDLLNSTDIEEKRDGVKRVIIAMTIGKNVSALFQPVIKCLEINELEIKKLIYLYIINNSRLCPDDALMIVNYLSKDARDKRALIRALAIRTFGGLKVAKLNEYLIEPLLEGLGDKSSFVRKTAVLAVGKMFEVSRDLLVAKEVPALVEKMLKTEESPAVAASALLTLHEMTAAVSHKPLTLGERLLERVLELIEGFSEWDQIAVLDILSESIFLVKSDSEEARLFESAKSTLLPMLSHCNSALVLAATKGLLVLSRKLKVPQAEVDSLLPKCVSAVVALLSTENEGDINKVHSDRNFIVLKCLQLLSVHFGAKALKAHQKALYSRQDDSLSVKIQKISLLAKVADAESSQEIITELLSHFGCPQREFALLVVPFFFELAAKHLKKADADSFFANLAKVVKSLKERRNYSILEQVVVRLEWFLRQKRRPGKAEHLLFFPGFKGDTAQPYQLAKDSNFTQVLHNLDECFEYFARDKTKAAYLRLLGVFFQQMPSAIPLLTSFKQIFFKLAQGVQIEVLETLVRLYLLEVEEVQDLLADLFEEIDEKTGDPSVKEQAFVFWRLIDKDPEMAKKIIGLTPESQESDGKSNTNDNTAQHSETKAQSNHNSKNQNQPRDSIDLLGLNLDNLEIQNAQYNKYDSVPANDLAQNHTMSNPNPHDQLDFGDFSKSTNHNPQDNQTPEDTPSQVTAQYMSEYDINHELKLSDFGTSRNLVEQGSKPPLFLNNRFYALKIRRKAAKLYLSETEKALVHHKDSKGEDGSDGIEILAKLGRPVYWNRSELSLFITIKNKSPSIHPFRDVLLAKDQSAGMRALNIDVDPKFREKYLNTNIQKNEIAEIEIPLLASMHAPDSESGISFEEVIQQLQIAVELHTKIDCYRFKVPFLINLLFLPCPILPDSEALQSFIARHADNQTEVETEFYGDDLRKVGKKLEANRIRRVKGTPFFYFKGVHQQIEGLLKFSLKEDTTLVFVVLGSGRLLNEVIGKMLQTIFVE